jgi:DNA invertase Pin-like site-specific DNA recombinase
MVSMSEEKSTPTARVVGYCRRSRERAESFGLDAQEDAIRRWAEYEGAVVVDVLRDDDTSGVIEPMQRPGGSQALAMLRAGEADSLVVAKFDRLARSIIGFAEILKLSEAEGWSLICLDPALDLRRASGRAMAAMLISFADIEREAFIDRMHGGRRAKAARGGYVGGNRLHRRFGFELVRQQDGGNEYVPVAAEQATIGRILEWRQAGRTLSSIAQCLEAEGTPPPSGARWHQMTISRIAKTAGGAVPGSMLPLRSA